MAHETWRPFSWISRLQGAREERRATATFPNDPWRMAWLETVRAECLLATGDARAARQAIAISHGATAKRWPVDSFYGARAAELMQRTGRTAPA